ncbi:hypothetical protein BH10ACI4_BH10ACI4_26790 [soil metagenome]
MSVPFSTYLANEIEGMAGPALAGCRAIVIIPARDEELILPRTLDSLRCQKDFNGNSLDHDSYEVLLLLNNCTDSSFAVAAKYQASYPTFRLLVGSVQFPVERAFVGTARRMLMDTAYSRLTLRRHQDFAICGILSTDADTAVSSNWIASNLSALESGADVVGGVIHLLPEDLETLSAVYPAVEGAYQQDQTLQKMVAELESILDPDSADPWPRHLQHFGASLACTPEIYARAGGLPPARALEDVAFVDALRKVGARIRHCPRTHVFTSARMDGRAEVGLSGQFRLWKEESDRQLPQVVDSAAWMRHRFSSMGELRRLHSVGVSSSFDAYPEPWRSRLIELLDDQLPVSQFLEKLNCDGLIEQMFISLGQPRRGEIRDVIDEVGQVLKQLKSTEN